MATANPPPGAFALGEHDEDSPFVRSSHDAPRHRYSAFDNSQSLYLNGSPEQAKMALQAHLSETARRLQETSLLGNSLVQQKKEIEQRLEEVERQQLTNEIGPELRQRLAELEKEFNEVGRETTRASFLPKSRVPSGETDPAAGASVYSNESVPSPSKLSVPSRKQRNQQPSRINDIALATEISTSLLSQLKELQSVLLDKDDALKAANLDRSQLEIEVEGLSQRLRTTDESENRLKDVNWGLETQVREFEAAAKAAADKENRLNHTLNVTRSEKSTLERDLEELKQIYAKVNDEHASKAKHHETELSGLRRNVTIAETEQRAMQRKIDELASQNQELAKAVAYRMRQDNQATPEEASPDDNVDEGDTITPEGSPPPSPNKATPRHGQLESETLKHSLNHAHRMIQQLKNNIHREKTEKLELKRMLQDARDEVETNRNLVGSGSASRRSKKDKDGFKKPARPDRLGALRTGTQVVVDEDEWEELEAMQQTPTKRPRSRSRKPDAVPGAFPTGLSSAAETSTEASDAFETANEREGTTTDAFQTGAETMDGDSSDELTETETEGGRTIRGRPSPLAIIGNRNSYQSTASTSGDEPDFTDIETPTESQHARHKLKLRQAGGYRQAARGSLKDLYGDNPSAARDSPASFHSDSNNSTPGQGRSLFAELGSFSGGESEDGYGTPGRSNMLSPETSPEARRRSVIGRSPLQSAAVIKPMVEMVDSEMMTEPWPVEPSVKLSVSTISSIGTEAVVPPRPALQISLLSTQDTEPRTAPNPLLQLSSLMMQNTEPKAPRQPSLQMSSVSTQDTEPRTAPKSSLQLSSLMMQDTEPRSAPKPSLQLSSLMMQDTEPKAPLQPSLQLSTVSTQDTEPKAPLQPSLQLSTVSTQNTVPRLFPAPSLGISGVSSQGTDPILPVVNTVVPPSLNMSSISQQGTEPILKEASQIPLPMGSIYDQSNDQRELSEQVPLQLSTLSSQTTQPFEENRPKPQFSELSYQATEPIGSRKPAASQYSSLAYQATEPIDPSRPAASQYSSLAYQTTEPIDPSRPAPPRVSSLSYQSTEPVEPAKPARLRLSMLSAQTTFPTEQPRPARLQLSVPFTQSTQPVEPPTRPRPQISGIHAQHTVPVETPAVPRSQNGFSNVFVLQDTQPESPTLPTLLPIPSRPSTAHRVPQLDLSLSSIFSQETEPLEPSRPATAHRTDPVALVTSSQTTQAEDKDITPAVVTVDEGTQTMVSAQQIDNLLAARIAQRYSGTPVAAGVEKTLSPPSSPRRSSSDPNRTPRRPGSSSSVRSRMTTPPPLPPDHKEVIAAAALKKVPSIPQSEMGPPIVPASAYKKRPQTPSIKAPSLVNNATANLTTPRPRPNTGRSGASSPMTRASSVSSFASELDRRFAGGANPFAQSGFDPNTTDPRMIQAITQTMIGEFLWKYTRKAGREGISENRHRRFFWVHPYTRTLYWSEHDPAQGGRNQLKAKSVAIESVQSVTDDNPYPPGLHRKSLLVITPGRSIKFTATTGQRHDTWFNALSYLLQRTGEAGEQGIATEEIQDEFNPAFRSISRQTNRSRVSYLSHRVSSPFSHRASSPHHSQVPTLRPSATPHQPRAPSTEPQVRTPSRLSTFFGASPGVRNSFTSQRSGAQNGEYSQSEHGSNYDLKKELAAAAAKNEKEIEGLENVRACCDGKHDVGHLHFHSHKGNRASASYTKSARSSLAGSIASRSHSRNA